MNTLKVLCVVSLVFATACGCDADLQIRSSGSTQSLRVGNSFTPSVRLYGCGGTEPLSDVITWAAQDTAIVRVDAASGLTLALRPGTTVVSATGQKYHNVGGVTVTVVAP